MNALVTGGTDGIGKEIARGLVRRGARVIIAGHDVAKGALAQGELQRDAGGEPVEFAQADLTLMRETERLATQVSARVDALDCLVLCAGMVRGRRVLTSEGIESNFALGYLSRFVLVRRLAECIGRARLPRILVINGAARNGTIYYDDVNLTRNFGTLRAIRQLCEANDILVLELARRWPGVTVLGLKVGVVRTNIRSQFPLWMKLIVPALFDPFVRVTPRQVAEAALHLLTSPDFAGASCGLFQFIKRFKPIRPGSHTGAMENGHRLWDVSSALVEHAHLLDQPSRHNDCDARPARGHRGAPGIGAGRFCRASPRSPLRPA